MKTKELLTALKELGDFDAVTGGSNGYPVPETGLAFFPNDLESLKKAINLVEEYDFNLAEFHQRDGWHVWEAQGSFYKIEQYKPFEADFGDNNMIVYVEDEVNKKEIADQNYGFASWGYDSWEAMAESEGEDDITRCKELCETLMSELEIGYNVINSDGYNVCLIDQLGYNYDTHNYKLGVYIPRGTSKGDKIYNKFWE